MKALDCPVCRAALREVVLDDTLIDMCAHCGGVWLDRGELERLRARSSPPTETRYDGPLSTPSPRSK